MNGDARLAGRLGEDFHLHFHARHDGDVEDLAMAGKPGIGPASVVADTDRGLTMNQSE